MKKIRFLAPLLLLALKSYAGPVEPFDLKGERVQHRSNCIAGSKGTATRSTMEFRRDGTYVRVRRVYEDKSCTALNRIIVTQGGYGANDIATTGLLVYLRIGSIHRYMKSIGSDPENVVYGDAAQTVEYAAEFGSSTVIRQKRSLSSGGKDKRWDVAVAEALVLTKTRKEFTLSTNEGGISDQKGAPVDVEGRSRTYTIIPAQESVKK